MLGCSMFAGHTSLVCIALHWVGMAVIGCCALLDYLEYPAMSTVDPKLPTGSLSSALPALLTAALMPGWEPASLHGPPLRLQLPC